MSRQWTFEEVEALYRKWRPDAVDGGGKPVLVAESDLPTRSAIADALFRKGFEPLEATDGLAALKLIRDRQPLACILSVELDILGGLDILEAIRRDSRHRTVPVVMITTNRQKQATIVARRSGAQAVFFKPCKMDELTGALQKLVVDAQSSAE